MQWIAPTGPTGQPIRSTRDLIEVARRAGERANVAEALRGLPGIGWLLVPLQSSTDLARPFIDRIHRHLQEGGVPFLDDRGASGLILRATYVSLSGRSWPAETSLALRQPWLFEGGHVVLASTWDLSPGCVLYESLWEGLLDATSLLVDEFVHDFNSVNRPA